jgi:hypothetical protein
MHWTPPIYRKSYKNRYGSVCFLDPKRLKYPICSKGRISCKGLNAAQYYSRLNKNKKLLKLIKTLKNKHKCNRN